MKKLAVILLALAFVSCGKSDETPPVVNIITPTDHQAFANGETVNVKAEISDETGIHMVHLVIVDNNGIHVDHFEEHLDAKAYTLNRGFPAQTGKTYTITAGGTDHADNTTEKTVLVTTN